MGMLQERLSRLPVEPFAGEDVPNTGGVLVRFDFVVNLYHRRVYRPLPPGSVAFTQILYVVTFERPDSVRDFVPLDAPVPLFTCPLLHCIVQEKASP